MRVQHRAPWLALLGRYDPACRPFQSRPRTRRHLASQKLAGRRSRRHPAFDRSDDPLAQIHAVGSAHSHLRLNPAEAESALDAAGNSSGSLFR